MSAMVEMSQAIRTTFQQYAEKLSDLPDDVLHDFALITAAYAADFANEETMRAKAPA